MKLTIDEPTDDARVPLTDWYERSVQALHLVFRPLVAATDGRVPAYEALSRGEGGGAVSALHRVRGHEVSRRLRALAARAADQMPVPLLFVGVAGADLLDEQLYDPTGPLGRVAGKVVLQLDERPVITNVAQLEARLEHLRRLGFRLAVTDGAGDGGLSMAQLVMPDFVKIGHPVLDLIHQSPARQRVVDDLCRLYHQLQMQVVADGIVAHADRLTAAAVGCDYVQGPCFGAPVAGFAGDDFAAREILS